MKSSPTELRYFEKLTKRRTEISKTLKDISVRGIWTSVVDKYTDKAHFIYELLQNADDAKATIAEFILEEDGLVFKHDGSIKFTISDPDKEEYDTKNKTLGHLNSITSVANSNKSENTIGKFGVGFKAVFQYTNTPHIYDKLFNFKLVNYIVPELLQNDFNGRNEDETLFYFPFDKEEVKEVVFDEIKTKLKSLLFPTLFLSNLKEIKWFCVNEKGSYSTLVTYEKAENNIVHQIIEVKNKIEKTTILHRLHLFTSQLKNSLFYNVGFQIENKENALIPLSLPAFCYFPTNEKTNLNFIINAPFLLNESRSGIKAGNTWNEELIRLLSKLAAQSLIILRDYGIKNRIKVISDKIFEIIPIDENQFSEIKNINEISFLPFYQSIEELFKNEKILPARNLKYVTKNNAYWASDKDLVKLISDKQLSLLVENSDASFVFTTLGRKSVQQENYELYKYITGGYERWSYYRVPKLVNDLIDPEKVFKNINKGFIEKQESEWLDKFYNYLFERQSYINAINDKPIFIDDDGNAHTAFKDDKLQIFLPSADNGEFLTISKVFLNYPKSIEFFKKIGITEPSQKDEILLKILPQYQELDKIQDNNIRKHFKKIFKYYCSCSQDELEVLINNLQDKYQIVANTAENTNDPRLCKPGNCYFPKPQLKIYFIDKPEVTFLDLDFYFKIPNISNKAGIETFFQRIGVNNLPKIHKFQAYHYQDYERYKNLITYSTRYSYIYDKYIDGCEEIIEKINFKKSIILWNQLLNLIKHHGYPIFKKLTKGEHEYFYRGAGYETFDSVEYLRLTHEKWLYDRNKVIFSSQEIYVEDLDKDYDINSEEAKDLINFLRLKHKEEIVENLNDSQREVYELGRLVKEKGFTKEEIDIAFKLIEENRLKNKNSNVNEPEEESNIAKVSKVDFVIENIKKNIKEREAKNKSNINTGVKVEDFFENIQKSEILEEETIEEDVFIKPAIDSKKMIQKIEEDAQKEIEKISKIEELVDTLKQTEKYSYKWFICLLEMEYLYSYELNSKRKDISIEFSTAEWDSEKSNILILKNANRHIPYDIEDHENISVKFILEKETKIVSIEVVSAQEFTLKLKIKTPEDFNEIDLKKVKKVIIDVKNPIFLLEELIRRFKELGFEDDFNLKEKLTKEIQFVFGPPGTGKTTYLARNVLVPLMKKQENNKVLVLAPTNKAADVLVNKLIEYSDENKEHYSWLKRFGITRDSIVEGSQYFINKNLFIESIVNCTVITTTARFVYDFFKSKKDVEKYFIRNIQWDYIIFDEASMISLPSIVYPLFNNSNSKFIIAGDPFQIQPISTVQEWKDENIYSLVELNKFVNPKTFPHDFEIINLTTQYRSIPEIGNLFSTFTYSGILKHARDKDSQKKIKISGFDIKALNIVKFPVGLESLFRAQRLRKTPYQTYSALLAYGLANYISVQIENQIDDNFKIGVICPYKAQADLVEGLFNKMPISSKKIDFFVGTIHGFQGDECNLIIALFNSPPHISSSPDMFLNKQNILNVAVSRARDFLIVMMPDDDTKNVNKLKKVKRIEKLIKEKSNGNYSEINSKDLEKVIFKRKNFIEKNTFVTKHQLINVYKDSQKLFEIRSEDNSLDVQIDPALKGDVIHNIYNPEKEDINK